MKKILLLAFLLLFSKGYSQSVLPEVIASSGDHFSTAVVQISWTLGEPVIETVGGATAQLTQGFHQPFINVNGIEEELPFTFSIYPNPGTGIINITGDPAAGKIRMVTIYSMQGQIVSAVSSLQGNQMDISFLPAGIYMLHIETEKYTCNFRLIKN